MEPVRRTAVPMIVGPVDLQLILSSTVNYKVKLQLIQKIFEYIEVILFQNKIMIKIFL